MSTEAFVTTSAPTYAPNEPNALSLDTSGNLRVTGTITTTPGGTQNVNIIQTNGVTQSTGAGATGTGSERVTVAQDTTTIAGSAPGTAGTPSTNVVSVQGVASGTVIPVAVTSGVPAGYAQASATSGQLGGLELTATTTSPPSYITGTSNPASTDLFGATRATIQDSSGNPLNFVNPVQIYISNTYANIISNATTVVKGSPGTLAKIQINNPGTAWVLTIYDNTAGSGTKIGTITVGATNSSYIYDVACTIGLTIVSSGTTAGDATVSYR